MRPHIVTSGFFLNSALKKIFVAKSDRPEKDEAEKVLVTSGVGPPTLTPLSITMAL